MIGPRTEGEVEQLLASGDCYVQPSIWRPDSRQGRGPASLDHGGDGGGPADRGAVAGVPELIRPGDTGWLVPPGNADAIADAVAAIVDHPEAARAVGRRGQDLVRREYDLELNLRRLEQAFLQAQPPGGAGQGQVIFSIGPATGQHGGDGLEKDPHVPCGTVRRRTISQSSAMRSANKMDPAHHLPQTGDP